MGVQDEEIAEAQKRMNDEDAAHESAYFQSGTYVLKDDVDEPSDPEQEKLYQRAKEVPKRLNWSPHERARARG